MIAGQEFYTVIGKMKEKLRHFQINKILENTSLVTLSYKKCQRESFRLKWKQTKHNSNSYEEIKNTGKDN